MTKRNGIRNFIFVSDSFVFRYFRKTMIFKNLEVPVSVAQVVERPLGDREVEGSKPGRAIPKALKFVPVNTLMTLSIIRRTLVSLLTQKSVNTNTAQLIKTITSTQYKYKYNNQHLYSSEDRIEDWHTCTSLAHIFCRLI